MYISQRILQWAACGSEFASLITSSTAGTLLSRSDHVTGVNHAYFFHPDLDQPEGDLRHQSEYTEVLFHRNVIMATYQIPEDQPVYIKGCLPLGEWVEDRTDFLDGW